MRQLFLKIRSITNLSEHIDVMDSMESIKKNIDFRGPNVWILAFAIIVASVGLNVNSIPVIIGAMLISPLMGPIMGVGLSISANDSRMLQQALKNLIVMVLISLFASFVYFLLSPLQLEEPTELLARTRPTIYDVFIALFGGLAGMVESARKEKGTVIAGVAIATALMPPLCTAGYGLATAQWSFFIGAFYLFLINSFFIALAVFLMARYMKYPVVKFNDAAKQRRVHRIIGIFSAITVIPSIVVAWMVIRENRFDYTAGKLVKDYFATVENADVLKIEKTYHMLDSSELKISLLGQPLSAFHIAHLKERMQELGLGNTRVSMTYRMFGGNSENQAASELLQTIYKRTEETVKDKDARIAQLEKELAGLKTDALPYAQIARELAVDYPALRKLTLSKGMQVDVLSGNPVQYVTAVVQWAGSAADAADLERLEKRLKVRLNEQHLLVMPVYE